ncbi:hypothetical protein KJ632_05960 [Patescibacteria group bacterium]|nr:hypothetical protein [Patescibacteria group bacterium]
MTEAVKPLYPQQKVDIKQFSDEVLKEFVIHMPPEEQKMWGQIIFQRKIENEAHRERNRDALSWLAVGVPIGVSLGVLAVWVLVVMPLWLQTLGL